MDPVTNLVGAAQAGSGPAFGEIFVRFHGMAYAAAYSFLRDPDLAEDAAQDAFIEAYLKIGALRDPAAFPGWLSTIVRRQCIRSIRGTRPGVVALDDVGELRCAEPGPDETALKEEEKRLLRTALNRLREHERAVLELFYFSGYSCREIASRLRISVPAVKKRLFDARKSLRLKLEAGSAFGLILERPVEHSRTSIHPRMLRAA